MLTQLRKDLSVLFNKDKAKVLQRFFKTGKGEYGEGDIFLGISVPKSRTIAQKYKNLSFGDIEKLLGSKVHEERLIALLILVQKFQKASEEEQEKIYLFYLANTKYINNWDLVDLSADKIVGEYLKDKDTSILTKLAASNNLWERRISIISTYAFIKRGDAKDALVISGYLLYDKHDLIQKAVGWMLREVGKRCGFEIEEDFLKKYYKKMPRTMLRYAIERFPEKLREMYMIGNI